MKKNLEPTNEKSLKLFWSNCQNPEIKNRKIAKIDNILNLDLEVVAHSKMVQITSKTSQLPIRTRNNPLKTSLFKPGGGEIGFPHLQPEILVV